MHIRHWAIVVVIALPFVLGGALAAYFVLVQARYDEAVAKYAAAGEPMSLAALGWTDVPDEDNVAAALLQLAGDVAPPSIEALDRALARPAIRWDVFEQGGRHIASLGDLRQLAWRVADDARQAAAFKKVDHFVVRLRQIHAMGQAIQTDTTLVGFLVGLAIQSLASQLVLEHDLPFDADAVAAIDRLFRDDPEMPDRIRRMARIERLYIHLSLTRPHPPGGGLSKWVERRLLLRDGIELLRLGDMLQDVLLAGSPASADATALSFHHRLSRQPAHAAMARLPESLLQSYRSLVADQRLARAVLAIRQFHARCGRLPTDWAELEGFGFKAPLLDPFDPEGRPLRLDPSAGVVYSVGRNRIDDGGRAPPADSTAAEAGPWELPDRVVRLLPEADLAAGRSR